MTTFSIGHYLDDILKKDKSNRTEIEIISKSFKFPWYKLYVEKQHLDWISYETKNPNLIFCLSGESELQIKDQKISLLAGNIIVLKNNLPYKVRILSDKTILIKFKLAPDFNWKEIFKNMYAPTAEESEVKSIFEKRYKEKGFIKLDNNNAMMSNQILNRAIDEYIHGGMYVIPVNISYLRLVAFLSLREQLFVALPTAKTGGFNAEVLTQYINTNFANISLEKAANYFGFNKNYFSSLVKKKTGKSFMEQVDERRMTETIRLLRNPTISLKEIIEQLGYSSKSFFYKKFNHYFGMTPTEMRKRLLKNN